MTGEHNPFDRLSALDWAFRAGYISKGLVSGTWHVPVHFYELPVRVLSLLPDDHTAHYGAVGCRAMLRTGPRLYRPCTRFPKHEGRHASGEAGRILAVWW